MPKQPAFNIDDVLSPEQKQAIIDQRVQSWAVDLYSHQLNRDAALEVDPAADVTEADNAIETITRAIVSAQGKAVEVRAQVEAKMQAEAIQSGALETDI